MTVDHDGATLIEIERSRQRSIEGYDTAHDRGHAEELAQAAACYADAARYRAAVRDVMGHDGLQGIVPPRWPWGTEYWKPTPDDRIRELVKAGALCAAAIDALQEEANEAAALVVER